MPKDVLQAKTVHNGGRYHARHRPLGGHLLLQPLQWSTVKGTPKWRAMAGPSTVGGIRTHSNRPWGPSRGGAGPADRGGRELPTDRGGLRVINKIGNCKFDSYLN